MEERLYFDATTRNRIPISKVLASYMPRAGNVLEIASGSGQHGVAFQKIFPEILWQTSDPDAFHRKSIKAWINHERLRAKMPIPLNLDVEKNPWPLKKKFCSKLKCIVCINMIHIASWNCTDQLFHQSAFYLKRDSKLIIYGPFKVSGSHISKSNELFDQQLRSQNSNWGVRDIDEVKEIASQKGFAQSIVINMPANNLSIIFTKTL